MEKRRAWRMALILATVFVVMWSIANLSAVTSILSFVGSVLLPILVGLGIAFILNIPLRFLERLWKKRFGEGRPRLRRAVCLIGCVTVLGGAVALLLWAILPQLFRTLGRLLERIPFYMEELQTWWGMLSDFLVTHDFPFSLPELSLDSEGLSVAIGTLLDEYGHHLLELTLGVAKTAFFLVWNLVLSFAISLYVLAQKERLSAQIRKLLRSLFSEKTTGRVLDFCRLTEKVFERFITGQVTEALIIGGLCFAGMLIFGMPYALLISVLVSVTALIPIFGAFIGTGIGAFLILLEEPMTTIWFVIYIIVLQQVEGNLIYPRVVGKSVGLPGVWVLIAVTVGSAFGIVGMLFSVPIASVGYSLLREFANRRCHRQVPEEPV